MVKLLLKFLNRIRIRIGPKIECLCASETSQLRQIHKKSFYLFIHSFIHSFSRRQLWDVSKIRQSCPYPSLVKIPFKIPVSASQWGSLLKSSHTSHKDVSSGFHRQLAWTTVMFCIMASPTDELIRRLQSVQNAISRLVTDTRRSDHISPALASGAAARRANACLPVPNPYPAMLRGLPGRRLSTGHQRSCRTTAFCWHSNARRQLDVQHCFRDSSFAAAAGTRVWNSLPPDLRQSGLSYGQFRRSVETFLFGQWDHGAAWTFLTRWPQGTC